MESRFFAYRLWRALTNLPARTIIEKTDKEKRMAERPIVPVGCFFKGSYNPAYEKEIEKGKDKCYRYNLLHPNDRAAQRALLRELFGKMGEEITVMPPFWCDYGYNIETGDHFYANHNLIIQDGAKVTFGDHVFIAPNCTITTAEHAVDPQMRKEGIEIAKPVTIGNNVWIGAGSVVKKDIPANVIAVGVPCKVLRAIEEKDKTSYPFYDGD